jgi:S-adenosyl-L-methionine hydrolase (adenosine-forming)
MTPDPLPTVFFLSDYGSQDEFVGVVHAVILGGAPGAPIVDLTHHITPFDVRAGSHALVRAVPHLGPGIILAVVDPGVGTRRRGLCIDVALPAGGHLYFVGPDNGLLVGAAEVAGEAPISCGYEVHRPPRPPELGNSFDGRDLFAPVVAALCRGTDPDELGDAIDPQSVVRLYGGICEQGRLHDGRTCVRAEVTWVDHFGNVQLAATVADARAAGLPTGGHVEVLPPTREDVGGLGDLPAALVPDGVFLRCVDAFADLAHGELGLLVDSNGHMAMVAGEASAAGWLNVGPGELVVLAW